MAGFPQMFLLEWMSYFDPDEISRSVQIVAIRSVVCLNSCISQDTPFVSIHFPNLLSLLSIQPSHVSLITPLAHHIPIHAPLHASLAQQHDKR